MNSRRTALGAAGLVLYGTIAGVSAEHPANPDVNVPETRYRSVIDTPGDGYIKETEHPRFAWPQLFEPNGRFRDEGHLVTRGATPPMHDSHRRPSTATAHSMQRKRHANASGLDAMNGAKAPGQSDARAVVRSIDVQNKKVKLKHGPIDKLDMPGMTMVFRVRDPALLRQVNEGDEVGITVEIDGTTFYVTGFQP
ncbi:MAG: copper-binding protein [Pseudomonadota bacterium]